MLVYLKKEFKVVTLAFVILWADGVCILTECFLPCFSLNLSLIPISMLALNR